MPSVTVTIDRPEPTVNVTLKLTVTEAAELREIAALIDWQHHPLFDQIWTVLTDDPAVPTRSERQGALTRPTVEDEAFVIFVGGQS